MYTQYYKQLSSIADQIREGAYQGQSPAKTQDENQPLLRRPQKEQEPQSDITDTLVGYMMALRSSETAPEVPSNRTTGGLNGSLLEAVSGPLEAAREALAGVESGGRYDAIGPVTRTGNRAYGRYQVMDFNIGPWTEEVLGRRYTPEEFLSDTKAQDAVVEYQLSLNKEKYGTWEDAASVWFSGRPMSRAGNASDGYTTVPEYVKKFQGFFGRYASGLREEPLVRRPA